MNLKYMSFNDVSLEKMCLHLELLISVQRVNHYILCLDNINAFPDKLNPCVLFLLSVVVFFYFEPY